VCVEQRQHGDRQYLNLRLQFGISFHRSLPRTRVRSILSEGCYGLFHECACRSPDSERGHSAATPARPSSPCVFAGRGPFALVGGSIPRRCPTSFVRSPTFQEFERRTELELAVRRTAYFARRRARARDCNRTIVRCLQVRPRSLRDVMRASSLVRRAKDQARRGGRGRRTSSAAPRTRRGGGGCAEGSEGFGPPFEKSRRRNSIRGLSRNRPKPFVPFGATAVAGAAPCSA
jgi:hypothetical protein